MSGIAELKSLLLGRGRTPRMIEHGEWPERSGCRRVLIENPDAADLWAHAGILGDAGYDVVTCLGPSAPGTVPANGTATFCPLVEHGDCPLVEGADVVVSTTCVTGSREILASLTSRRLPALVVEGTSSALERDSDVIPAETVRIAEPVTPELLLTAVGAALADRGLA